MEKTVLLVEDNADDELLILRALEKGMISQDIVVTHDGVEALDYLFGRGTYARHKSHLLPHVVLLDLRLPRLDGLQVLRRLRAHERTRLLPVVILTSSDEERDIVASYQSGANSYVRKPVGFAQFSQAVQQVVSYWLTWNEVPPARRKH
jgi:CheY-like chemotaxis protein